MNKKNTPIESCHCKHGNPLVTCFLLTYNQEKYVKEACESILNQTYPNLEIIISDDCSTDSTQTLISECVKNYNGPHKVIVDNNGQNIGIVNQINKAFRISSSDMIVIAAGDDISEPYRVKTLVEEYLSYEIHPILVHSSVNIINNEGVCSGIYYPPHPNFGKNIDEYIYGIGIYIGATGLLHRDLYQIFGPLSFRMAYEDSILGFRALLLNSIAYINKPLVNYRAGGYSATVKRTEIRFIDRILDRPKKLSVILDVLRQRLVDIEHLSETIPHAEKLILKIKLIHNLYEKRFLLYQHPFDFFLQLFSLNLAICSKAFYWEFREVVLNTYLNKS